MSTKDEFVRKMHSQLDRWNAEIDALSARASAAEADARGEYQKQIDALRARRDEARDKLKSLEAAGENAWEDMKAGVELAWDAVSDAVRSAVSRFR